MKDNLASRVYLYGLDEEYRVVHHLYVNHGWLSIRKLTDVANHLKLGCPSVRFVYAVDNSLEICREYHKTVKQRSVENRVLFKLLLEECGIRV